MSSRSESLPYVILESLSMDIPVVSQNVWWISELKKYTNMIYLCDKIEDYIKYINYIFSNKDIQYYNNISQISIESQMEKYMKVYSIYL